MTDLFNGLYPRLVLAPRTEVGTRIHRVEMATLVAAFLEERQGLARQPGLYNGASPTAWNDL